MRKIATILLALSASMTSATQAVAQAGSKETLKVSDRTPADEKKQHILSVWLWSCDYFITRLDDRTLKYDRIHELTQQLGLEKELSGTIEILSYKIYLNAGASAVDKAFAAGAGVAGGVLVGSSATAPKCSAEKTSAGWFSIEETRNSNPPLISELSVTYNGKIYKSRVVMSPVKKFDPVSKNAKYAPDKKRLLELTVTKLAQEIESGVTS